MIAREDVVCEWSKDERTADEGMTESEPESESDREVRKEDKDNNGFDKKRKRSDTPSSAGNETYVVGMRARGDRKEWDI